MSMHVYVVVSLFTGACSEERRALTWSHLDPEGDASGFPQWMTALPRAAAASTISSDCRSGEPFLVVLIISVVTTAVAADDKTRLVNDGASASLPRKKRQLPGVVSVVSWSWP
jgi:hypothetical protein